jgi:ribonucleotide reductase beta subunit family protein with ferritin-like domain
MLRLHKKKFIALTLTGTAANSNNVSELVLKLRQEIKNPEARSFMILQRATLTGHNEIFGKLLQEIVNEEPLEKFKILKENSQHPMIQKKTKWTEHHCNSPTLSLAEQVIATIAVESIFSATAIATSY